MELCAVHMVWNSCVMFIHIVGKKGSLPFIISLQMGVLHEMEDLQGTSKELFPGCEHIVVVNYAFLPAEGK